MYRPLIDQEKETDISLHLLVILNLLSSIENAKPEMIKQQIKVMKESQNDVETYINTLQELESWKTGLVPFQPLRLLAILINFHLI